MTRIAVVGGGIAGASAAYELAGSAEVVLLERESVCGYHSTGRSAALFTECYGDPIVRRMAIASRGFLGDPPAGFSEHPILRPRPVLFTGTEAQQAALQTAFDDYRSLVPAVRQVSSREAVELCPVLDDTVIVGGVVEPGAADIDVHELHVGFLKGLRARGGTIITSAGVTGLRSTGAGWSVASTAGSHEVDVVVNAAGAWCDVVGTLAGARPIGLVPHRRTAFTFRCTPDPRDWPMVVDVDERWYFRPEGTSVLASPADETPMAPVDVRHDEVDVALGIERINAVTTLSITSVDRAWAGLRSFVVDHRPVNGWDPDLPGFYWLAGQGGYGIKTSPAMARFAAGMIRDGVPPADLLGAGVGAEEIGVERLRAPQVEVAKATDEVRR